MKLGIIGFGNMAEAILGGILENGFIAKEDVTTSGKDEAMLQKASEKYGIAVNETVGCAHGSAIKATKIPPISIPNPVTVIVE